jgi:hypothetical protein
MEYFKIVFEISRAVIYAVILGSLIATLIMPSGFGQWLQQIDNGRFEYMDCHVSTEWEEI